MSLPTLRRCFTVGVLAAVLTAAAPANARDLGSVGHAWLWLQDVWTQGVSALWEGRAATKPEPRAVPYRAKATALDPSAPASPQGSAGPPCPAASDQGLGLDPNG